MGLVCGFCHREFSDFQCYQQHLKANSNIGCQNSANRKQGARALSDSTNDQPCDKKQKVMARVSAALDSNKHDNLKRAALKEVDMSVFDFHDYESDPNGPPPPNGGRIARKKSTSIPSQVTTPVGAGEGITTGLSQFKAYVALARSNHARMEPPMEAAAELMSILNKVRGASLALYMELSKWHARHQLGQREVSAVELHKTMLKRHNMEGTLPYQVPTWLSHAETTVLVVCHDFTSMLVDLLTDPRIKMSDFLFPGGEPGAVPWWGGEPGAGDSHNCYILRDVIDGEAYKETHRKLIKPQPLTPCGRKRVLLPMIFYIDGCVTGQFNNQQLEVLKFTTGILCRETRLKHHAWRHLGYMPQAVKGHGRAREMIDGDQHLDTSNYHLDPRQRGLTVPVLDDAPSFDAGRHRTPQNRNPTLPKVKAQDAHTILHTMLASHKKVQDAGGMDWDFFWNDKLIHCRLVPFVLFVAVDGKEADKLSGQCTCKTENVANLCRFCCCPTDKSNVAYRDDRRKTEGYIHALVKNKRSDVLKNMSQQETWNAFHGLTFGQHNRGGIHQALPPDPMHWGLIGQLGRTRDDFFFQTGVDSKLSKEINALATSVGWMLQRQSVSDLPRVTFNRGIQDGKMMAHEMMGTHLLLTGTLRCTRGRTLLLEKARGEQKVYFKEEGDIRKWLLLLETQLQLMDWLKLGEVEVEAVERLDPKMKECMNMVQQIGLRSEGMESNTANHHAAKHFAECIRNFGPAPGFDTPSMESDHIHDKTTAQRTNKQAATFNQQVSVKSREREAIALAVHEMSDDARPRWHYYLPKNQESEEMTEELPPPEPILSGVRVRYHLQNGNLKQVVHSRMAGKDRCRHDAETMLVIKKVTQQVEPHLNSINVHSLLKIPAKENDEKAQLYRASPLEAGKPWYDWAMCDLSSIDNPTFQNDIPCHIKCFIDLRDLPPDQVEDTSPGTYAVTSPGIYAVVEPTMPNDDLAELGRSDTWHSHVKTPHEDPAFAEYLHHCVLLHVDRINGPTCLMPDLGNKNKRAYLRLVDRKRWAQQFNDWVKSPHARNFDFPDDDPPHNNQ